MKQLLLICAVVVGQSVLAADKKPLTKEEQAKLIENAIRYQLKKPTGELTKADLEKVTKLYLNSKILTEVPKGLKKLTQLTVLDLGNNQLTDVKGLEKLTQLTRLNLAINPALTKAQIDELQKALPKCYIYSNPTK
jgi:Leucine-rich repeat (LRR) protein